MKKNLLILFFAFLSFTVFSQEEENPLQPGNNMEQQLENLAERQEGETEDDSYLQKLDALHKNPLNLNTANEDDLREIGMISEIQVRNFIKYRRLLRALISIYELQAIPGWDIETIRKILPYIKLGNAFDFHSNLKQRLTSGASSILVRSQQTLEKSNGYLRPDSIANRYMGSPQRLFSRYKYRYQNLLEFGLTADKDAGEQFFKGNQKYGFDFYSFHLFARKLGAVKSLALGDFVVNLGQGLIQWQSLAFKKSVDIASVKRQANVLEPYSSAGEYNFNRGAGITVGGKYLNITTFGSVRHLDAVVNNDTTSANNDIATSLPGSGLHRTPNEVSKKNTITQTSFGGNISYNKNSFHLGVNSVAFKFSVPLVRDIRPYNQYAIQGSHWYNYSIDYSYTFRNYHFFGEAAVDKNNSKAFVGGLLASLDEKMSASLVYRNIQKSYQSLYGNAFTENTFPSNEKGLFTGINLKPARFLTLEAYADVFSFPWLRYRADAPSQGSEYLIQATYKAGKKFEVFTRFRVENKASNLSGLNVPTAQVNIKPNESWRTQVNYNLTRQLSLRSRVELLWLNPGTKDQSEHGILLFAEGRFKPFNKAFSLNGRVEYFETDSFDSRIYSFESDVLYSYTVPQFVGQGWRYYLNINYDVSRKLTIWGRFSRTIYKNQSFINSGLDKIDGNKKSEIKLQFLYNL